MCDCTEWELLLAVLSLSLSLSFSLSSSFLSSDFWKAFSVKCGKTAQTGPLHMHNDWHLQIKKWLLLSFHWRMSQTRKGAERRGRGEEETEKTLRGCCSFVARSDTMTLGLHQLVFFSDAVFFFFSFFLVTQGNKTRLRSASPTPPSPLSRLTHPAITGPVIHM